MSPTLVQHHDGRGGEYVVPTGQRGPWREVLDGRPRRPMRLRAKVFGGPLNMSRRTRVHVAIGRTGSERQILTFAANRQSRAFEVKPDVRVAVAFTVSVPASMSDRLGGWMGEVTFVEVGPCRRA